MDKWLEEPFGDEDEDDVASTTSSAGMSEQAESEMMKAMSFGEELV